jgi:hypothetical protein
MGGMVAPVEGRSAARANCGKGEGTVNLYVYWNSIERAERRNFFLRAAGWHLCHARSG